MRVLSIGNLYPPAAAGGYERIWLSTMQALERAGHEVRILTTAPVPGRPVEGEDPPGPPVFRELRWYWRDFGFPRMGRRERRAIERWNASVLERHLEELDPDVVSWWGMGGMSLSLLDRVRRAGVPAVGLVGDAWMAYGPQVAPGRADIGAAARWLFISDWLRRAFPVPRSGLAHPGIDPERFRFSRPGEWGWRLLYAGRVEPRKGVRVAVEALAGLPDEAVLTVDGPPEGEHARELEALARRLRVGGRVRFSCSAPDAMASAYAGADAVLFPVEWEEPWGLVPLEAMSVGRPVVATGTGGSAEYLEGERNCLLTAPGDAAALAAAVRRLAEDPRLRARLVEGGRATAARYSQDAFEQAVIAALAEEAAGRRRASG